MAGQLYTTAETAEILRIPESWLKAKATARIIPCTFIGKHLRFSDDDIAEIISTGSRPALRARSGSQERKDEENHAI